MPRMQEGENHQSTQDGETTMKVKLCGTTWTIEENANSDDGDCNFNLQTISINKSRHPHRKALSLTHEMLHVICDRAGIEEDEEMIKKIEHGVLELIKIFPEKYKNA
jgi:Zn-dependent peptidase ImmA (M78 family)